MEPILLYEFGESKEIIPNLNKEQLKEFKKYLSEVWSYREHFFFQNEEKDDSTENTNDDEYTNRKNYQPFLKFDGNKIEAKNYVGFIQYNELLIKIYPKVFDYKRGDGIEIHEGKMMEQLIFWFKHFKQLKCPISKATLDSRNIDNFPELLIRIMALQIFETISTNPISLYQQIEESTQIPKGRINFNRFINNSLSHGNFHILECDYEPFLFDNKLNRIIKYCTKSLRNFTRNEVTSSILQEIIFILDEVEDRPCTIYDLEGIHLNTFYDDYLQVITICKMILLQQLYSHQTEDFSKLCMMFPMEDIFEDFVAGFLEENFSDKFDIDPQNSDRHLVDKEDTGGPAFKMKHDIYLTDKNSKNPLWIIDTKYKIRDINKPNKGIFSADMYQMVSYALKRQCENVLLLYPGELKSGKLEDSLIKQLYELLYKSPDSRYGCDTFSVSSGWLSDNMKIYITAAEIPFYSKNTQ